MNISEMFAEQVERLFSDRIDRNAWVNVEAGQVDSGFWHEVSELGLSLAMCREASGGAGLSWAECEPALRLTGTHAAPAPVGETLVAAWLLDSAGLEIPPGQLTLAGELMGLDEQGRLNGIAPLVSWLPQAGHVVVLARQGQEQHLCLVNTSQGTVAELDSIARTPYARLDLNAVEPLHSARVTGYGETGLLPFLAALRSIQMAGAMARVLDLCVEYANTREQFGKPIGKFQAIAHLIADLAAQTASAQVAGLYAARQIDAGQAEAGAAVAKSLVGRAATRVAASAHQVFGAIGVTDEHSLHYFTRRLWQWRAEAGSEHWWSERLGRQALASEGAALWPSLTRPLRDA